MLQVAYDITSLAESPFGGIAQVCQNTLIQAALAPDVSATGFFKAGKRSNGHIEGATIRRLLPLMSVVGPTFDIAHSLCHRRLKVKARRAVYTVHDVWSLQPNRYQPDQFQAKVGARLRNDIARADYVVAISETTRQSLLALDLVRPENCRAVHLGVTIPQVPKSAAVSPPVQALIEKTYVIYVGSLEIRTNIGHLLEAVAPLTGVDLVIAGQPGFGFEDKIEPKLASFPRERLHLFDQLGRKELALLYKNAVAMILPSWEEGFGLPIVEAMACSCPVITSNRSANAEIAGEAGILIDPSAPRQTGLAVEKLLDDKSYRERFIAAGHEQIKRYNWETYYANLLEIYHALLA